MEESKQEIISTEESLRLQLIVVKKQNAELKQTLLSLQAQLNDLRIKNATLELDMQKERLNKESADLEESFQAAISGVQTKYGIDLSKDKINLDTGTITRAGLTNASEPSQNTTNSAS